MRNENVPTPASPETPPLAPYDPPAPAPQAAAWRQALKVIGARAPRADYAWTADRRGLAGDRRRPVDEPSRASRGHG
jgi:hypothetical protein